MNCTFVFHAALVTTLMLGCGSQEREDNRDDSFLSIEERSVEAIGVLVVANTVGDEALRDNPPDGVGLSERGVDNLIYLRLGDDGLPGTEDDGHLDTLAELDAVPFIGPIAYEKLLAYARDHGFIDPECPASCEPEIVARGQHLTTVVLDDTHVYWLDTIGKVMRRAKAGGSTEEVGTGAAFALTVDATHVYWAEYNNSGKVLRRTKTLGEIEEVATGQSYTSSLASDGSHVYWTNYIGNAVMRREIGPTLGQIETIATMQPGADGLSLDSTHVYWAADDAIRRRTKAPGTVEPIATAQIGAHATALDDTHVYWTAATDGTVMRRSKAPGPIETFAGDEGGVEEIAVDADGVYWTMLHDSGGIRRRAKSGGDPADIADDTGTDGIALDATHIYWTAADPGGGGGDLTLPPHRVMRLPRCACGL